MAVALSPNDVLVVVDMQYDFLPGGSLAVRGGDEIIAPIARLAARFETVVLTQDWHPAGHVSFASSHAGRAPFEVIELDYGPQVLWPDHCVVGSRGAEIVPELRLPNAHLLIRKGFHPRIDSYSGFEEADRRTRTGLAGYLRERGLVRVFTVGLATDFCVGWTALDARAAGFATVMVEDLTRPIDQSGSLEQARARMDAAGVVRLQLADIS